MSFMENHSTSSLAGLHSVMSLHDDVQPLPLGGKGTSGSSGHYPEVFHAPGSARVRASGRNALYRDLVALRQAHRFPQGLLNPAELQGGRFDSAHLGPWSRWQGNLDAEVVVVGQAWGDASQFLASEGRSDEFDQTSMNLREMVQQAGWDLGSPLAPQPQPFFLTNAILGIRAAGPKAKVPPNVWIDDSVPFLTRLLDIIQPRVVVSLGGAALRACRLALLGSGRDDQIPAHSTLNLVHSMNPLLRPGKPAWFAFYHCSPLGLSNRSKGHQLEDWHYLGERLGARATGAQVI